jgi:integrase/recombinase XerC
MAYQQRPSSVTFSGLTALDPRISAMGIHAIVARNQFKHSEFNLDPQQIRQLVAGAETTRDRAIIALLAYTGVRRAELRDIRVEDVEKAKRRVLIRLGKGGKSRFVFFPPTVGPMLEHLIDGRRTGPLILNARGQSLSVRSINEIVASVARAVGVRNPNPRYSNVTPHLLRHSFARNWKRSAGSLESLQKILGHASFSTTMDLYGTESLDETNSNYSKTIGSML